MNIQSTLQLKILNSVVLSLMTILFFLPKHSSAAVPEEEFFADIPEVLTATRLRQPVSDAPASMTIIDRNMIEASGARDIVDVFRLVPGFQVQHENGHTPVVTYHGMSDQYSKWMQVLIDGRAVYSPSAGGVEWSHIPLVLDEIERIEITRGPNAASFGSNAFSAIINIITKHSSETNGTFFRVSTGKPNDLQDVILQYGNNVELREGLLNYRITLGKLKDDGFEDRYDIMEATLGRFRLDYDNSKADTWLFQTGFNTGPRGLDAGNNYDYPERNREKDIEYTFQQLRWTHEINKNEEFYIQFFHNYHKVDETNQFFLTADEFGLTGAPQAIIDAYNLDPVQYTLHNSLRTRRYDLEIQHTIVPRDDLRIAWGGSVRRDQWFSPGLISSDDTINIDMSRVFANTEWHATSKMNVNAGAMWENSELTGSSLSPRAGIVYHLDDNHNLRVVASQATRIPTMIEYDGDIVVDYSGQNLTNLYGFPDPSYDTFLRGTKDLEHEKITSMEIGINSRHNPSDLTTDIRIFRDLITDIIYFESTTDPLQDIPNTDMAVPLNGEDVVIYGMEFQADAKPFAGNRIIFSYSLSEIVSKDLYEDYSETSPSESISLLLSQRFANTINASMLLTHTAWYEGLGSGNPVGPYSRADIRIAYPFNITSLNGEVALVSQNISGQEIYDWYRDNSMKNRHMLTVSGRFK